MNERFTIRNIEPRDYDYVLELNEINVEVLSPMDMNKLLHFLETTELFQVAEVDGRLAAFMIVLREGKDYGSENYLYFSKKFDEFLYIDRIVIDEFARGIGLGRTLYNQLIEHAKKTGVKTITAEIDTEPVYNNVSLLFHEAMGFKEVGVQYVRDNTIKVSLQALELE